MSERDFSPSVCLSVSLLPSPPVLPNAWARPLADATCGLQPPCAYNRCQALWERQRPLPTEPGQGTSCGGLDGCPSEPRRGLQGSPFVLRPWGEISALAQAQDAVRTEERALDCVCVWGACVVCVSMCMWGVCVVRVCAGAVALGESV